VNWESVLGIRKWVLGSRNLVFGTRNEMNRGKYFQAIIKEKEKRWPEGLIPGTFPPLINRGFKPIGLEDQIPLVGTPAQTEIGNR